jgi:hypothetical protein
VALTSETLSDSTDEYFAGNLNKTLGIYSDDTSTSELTQFQMIKMSSEKNSMKQQLHLSKCKLLLKSIRDALMVHRWI